MYSQHSVSEQDTLPLSAIAFRCYIQKHQIEPLDVALNSGVRYLTVWRIWQGLAIKSQYESLIQRGLWRMTGIPYIAPMLVRDKHDHADTRQARKTTPPRRPGWR